MRFAPVRFSGIFRNHQGDLAEEAATPWNWRTAVPRTSGVTVLDVQDFGAQPGDLNPLGYKDSIGQPAIEGSGVEPLPGKAVRSKRANSSSGELSRRGRGAGGDVAAGCAGRNGTFVGLRKYQSRVGAFNSFLRDNAETDEENVNCWQRSWSARWRKPRLHENSHYSVLQDHGNTYPGANNTF